MKMTELARRTGVPTSRLSHLTDRLEQRGWVYRLTARQAAASTSP